MSEQTTNIPAATGWQTFGHDAAVRALNAANMSGRLAHAYLLTGPERIGRRTLALDLACLLNCEPQPDLFGETPVLDLSTCPAAQRIRASRHADVRTINTATPIEGDRADGDGDESRSSTRQLISINHIQELQRDAALKPFEGKARVFIIDGAESLSQAAANNLLKTLEEPAEEVYIILVAADPQTVPETVVSRCQRISLRPVPAQTIRESLVERFGADPEQADRLARLAAGRPGWAISALQDPAVLEIYTQTAARILSVLSAGIERRFSYANDLSLRYRRDRSGVFAELQRWLEIWRDIAVTKAGLGENVMNADWQEGLEQAAAQLTDQQIASASGVISDLVTALEANAIPRLAIEVAMLDLPEVRIAETVAGPN